MSAKKKTVTEKNKVDPTKFNHVAAHAKVMGIRLVRSRFDIKPEALGGYKESWTYNATDELQDWHCDNETHLLRGTFNYEATCSLKRKKLIIVKGEYLCTYRLSAECDPEAGMHFLQRVGRFAAYPYFRSLFATLTQQSGLMIPPLPVISEQPRWVTPPARVATDENETNSH